MLSDLIITTSNECIAFPATPLMECQKRQYVDTTYPLARIHWQMRIEFYRSVSILMPVIYVFYSATARLHEASRSWKVHAVTHDGSPKTLMATALSGITVRFYSISFLVSTRMARTAFPILRFVLPPVIGSSSHVKPDFNLCSSSVPRIESRDRAAHSGIQFRGHGDHTRLIYS
ncbi:hypothetical protein EDB85DRAFT_169623 [Lactarius pseudohatsudake]|nr:hypothetical protein EDB85DRAFT_169623 [Lactarius pseudohatsudake]